MHDSPGQQSALLLHAPHDGTHCCGKQVSGPPPSAPPGTHGLPLQQSALVAHAPPASRHCETEQRGTPRLSCLHVSAWQLPLQQSHDELQLLVARRHTAPLGLQPVGFWQTPTAPPVPLHVAKPPCDCAPPPSAGNAAEPQHSLSFVHRSPTRWHPLAGWQTRTPVGPHGAQARLQHAPPHAGMPPSRMTTPPSFVVPAHSMPSVSWQLAPEVGTAPQRPSAFVPVFVQTPEQQSVALAHESPFCPQKDGCWQMPPRQ